MIRYRDPRPTAHYFAIALSRKQQKQMSNETLRSALLFCDSDQASTLRTWLHTNYYRCKLFKGVFSTVKTLGAPGYLHEYTLGYPGIYPSILWG